MKRNKQKEAQHIDENLMFIEYDQIRRCYDHFKLRVFERFGQDLSYEWYWTYWTCFFRGLLVQEFKDNKTSKYRMIRMLGDYHNDEFVTVIVYIQIKKLNIYVPLTLYNVTEHKEKHRLYLKVLENKKKNAQ